MDAPDIRYLGDLQRLDMKEGDRFVLTCEGHVSLEMQEQIQKAWKVFIGEDAEKPPLLVLDRGFKLGVINQKAA